VSPHQSTRVHNGGRGNFLDHRCSGMGLTLIGSERVSLAGHSRRALAASGHNGAAGLAKGTGRWAFYDPYRSRFGGAQPGTSTEVAELSHSNEAVTVV
jgi:hypothetical protein